MVAHALGQVRCVPGQAAVVAQDGAAVEGGYLRHGPTHEVAEVYVGGGRGFYLHADAGLGEHLVPGRPRAS